uniref:C-CAP/cofactor C-like domain-containing protein n=1 Tax=Chromera velia CCMP2878 TaxID=1169474 RepID=A0A0G4IA07_9ALVE|eukprot:Cvel_2060.t1-p1 / transcript=Cvel_2060.t1 / gene=Cvel_2060 / organism=Chromera_velia_CCMP2878 / gene_product=Protein XRP2, putative / transcript_product=Protein XRP2, putative / location=Cvel_scaffold79:89796-95253(-) / protein_length=414 / sequence_SO=supercontig / SO=protein_coding / is_pseudo=false
MGQYLSRLFGGGRSADPPAGAPPTFEEAPPPSTTAPTQTKPTPADTQTQAGSEAAAAAPAPPAEKKPVYSWEKKRRDPKDFIFSKRTNEVLVKEKGSIAGQQFVIEECEGCDIFVLDWTDSITVDECKDCRLFVGPVAGSIFIRDCTSLQCHIVCQQFRCRDLKDCDIALHVTTEPVIESSSSLRIGCLDFTYDGLDEHMRAANLSPFSNKWWQVFDFSKKDGETHWTPLKQAESSKIVDTAQGKCTQAIGRAGGKGQTWALPVVLGPLDLPPAATQGKCVILFCAGGEEATESGVATVRSGALLSAVQKNRDEWHVLKSRALVAGTKRLTEGFGLSEGAVESLMKSKAKKKKGGVEVSALLLGGASVTAAVEAEVKKSSELSGWKDEGLLRVCGGPEGEELEALVFEVWKDEI